MVPDLAAGGHEFGHRLGLHVAVLRLPDVEAHDLALAVRVDGHRDYRRHRDDAPALALLQIGRVQP
jgi:hypothetical protein